ncbi:MAG TPA: universal stress protein [bacterium]|nr:universal stress protein [bacterium]
MFTKILDGYYRSELARKALQIALDLAGRDASPVLAVAVVRPPPSLQSWMARCRTPSGRRLKDRSPRRFGARNQARQREVHLTLLVRVGHPADTLVRIAEEEGCGLIVLGRRGLQRGILGSVSERVLRYAHCPVMAMP